MATEQQGVSPATAGGAPLPEVVAEVTAYWNRVMAFAAGEPDPRDAEIERLRAELRQREQRGSDAYAELLNPIRAVFSKPPVTASHYRELHDSITALIGRLNAKESIKDKALTERDDAREEWKRADAEVTRLKRLVGNENVPYDGWDEYSRQDAIVRCKEGWQEYLKVRDERDELKTKLIDVSADLEWLRAALGALRDDFNTAVDALTENPVEPRHWLYGDPQPEIGTTVRIGQPLAGGTVWMWTRQLDGEWHDDVRCDRKPSNGCTVRVSWGRLLREYGELVEVVSTDGQ